METPPRKEDNPKEAKTKKIITVFEIIVPLSWAKKDATFTLRHIVTECDMIHEIFLDF